MSTLRRLRRDDRGAAIIEFALLAPVLLGLMLGVLQMGLQMQSFNALRARCLSSCKQRASARRRLMTR